MARCCARGVPVTWLGADGAMETRLVPQHDIPIDTLAITGLRGKGMVKLLGAPLRVMRARAGLCCASASRVR